MHACARPLTSFPRVLLLVTSLLQVVPEAGAIVTIDDFDSFSFLTVSGPPSGPASNFASYSTGQAIGGERDALIERTSSNSGAVSMDISGSVASQLSYASAPFTSGALSLSYDGSDGSLALNPLGLGGIDITQSGVNTGIFLRSVSDLGAMLTFTIYSGADYVSRATIPISADPSFTFSDYFSPFTSFSSIGSLGGADFTQVGAITLELDGGVAGTDVSLETVFASPTPVPEPSGCLLLACAGMAMLRQRRRS